MHTHLYRGGSCTASATTMSPQSAALKTALPGSQARPIEAKKCARDHAFRSQSKGLIFDTASMLSLWADSWSTGSDRIQDDQFSIGSKRINSLRRMPRTILEQQRIHSDTEQVRGRFNISAGGALHHLKQVHFNHVPNAVSAVTLKTQIEVGPHAAELTVHTSLSTMMRDLWKARSLCLRNVIVKRQLQRAIAPLSH